MKHVPHSTFATSIQKIHTMKADISITKSRKGTEIVVSGKRINKYGIIAAIVFAVPMLILFQSIHGETTSHLSLVRFFMCILAAVLVNLFLHKLLFRLFSPIRMWQYRTTCLLPFLLLVYCPLYMVWQVAIMMSHDLEYYWLSWVSTTFTSSGNYAHSAETPILLTNQKDWISTCGKFIQSQ